MTQPIAERHDGDGLVEYLVDRCGLSGESAEQIREIMRTGHMAPGAAAVLSGLLTDEQAEEAIRWTADHPGQAEDSVIESALRRSANRQLVVKSRLDGPEIKPGPDLLFGRDPYAARSEKIRALRTELLLARDSSSLTLAVVGAGPREGRSLLAAELALAFGQLGGRTLLVDADMRNPTQHVLFQTSNSYGLGHCIDGRHPELIYRVAGFAAMGLLTAGTALSNPLELLSDMRFERLTESWRKHFEFTIIDTPPIGGFADGLTVATVAGRVLVVGRAVTTSFRELKDMLRRLTVTQAHIVGAVINDF
ncbi:MAG TPA: CpsD/CapB family tyrosine-protein kinase [Steroidobacteraceae bacterium]|nr:CpsD/CapB family tyrosine-protein kinase [Steroidobacteraceae bacterium]